MDKCAAKKLKMTALEQLKTMTTVVADTGDFEGILTYFLNPFGVFRNDWVIKAKLSACVKI